VAVLVVEAALVVALALVVAGLLFSPQPTARNERVTARAVADRKDDTSKQSSRSRPLAPCTPDCSHSQAER